MKIIPVKNYAELSEKASASIIQSVKEKPDLLFCAATGGSPTGMYAQMHQAHVADPSLFSAMRTIKMDEWGIIPSEHPDSCESYLKKHLLGPLDISEGRYVSFDTQVKDFQAECDRVQSYIEQEGPMDICILGLGKNGHIAFNEPGEYLQAPFHKAILAESTIQHDPALSQGAEPAFGLCVGMEGILQAKKIIFLITGKGKQDAYKTIMERKITTNCPATFLWMHPNVECYVDQDAI
ncbi:glucosamine-6-phosphate deaminase [Aquirufa ecclesiirivi]|uniref:Glucosamine-6-phosphate deaminase n=1 Tax=Aquirufa ecclesiirivi TaxID=2715124 RepID=A0ABT4JFL3_9BACT|nr:6-phosphogluconolactonase [Aquirufa ecclesiirivi]MCZ2475060.1 glucosamine-6-phosphate deaminase [Aquirufa ecclesiirivi]